ncbi:methicillin resistance protein [Dictyobacter alpinus]|uniref:Methicillin resistance protein n=1 Tax=Dictyobacter alpinus TaxID=2014873 RepID=A0A402B4K8_9CHLR|nr:peptidoglycan bridge formation glycyltransferase FemA/FemB family protein [Dictyobacter alpinus]GCE26272.1 methicillin resistance protein [Dictyobacter alpinus]
MEACLITDAQKWNDFIATSPFGAITQTYEWGILARRAESIPLYCGVLDDQDNLCAAMLILVMRLPKINNSYFYVPRGPIITDPDSAALSFLLHFVDSLARKYNAFMLKIDPVADQHDAVWLQAFAHHGFMATDSFIHGRGEWVLDIYPDEKQQLAHMKEKWRYNVRLAQRKGVKIRQGHTPEDIQIFHTILQETSERDQFFIHAVDHFEYLMKLFEEGEKAELFLAEYEGQAIAGIIVMRSGQWCWYRYGASSSQGRNVMPNHLLQWTSLQWGREHGCTHYNFMGIPAVLTEAEGPKDPNWGVYNFKRGFGGQARCAMRSQEKPYNPTVYRLYTLVRELKHRYATARYERSELARKRQEYQTKKGEESLPAR